MEPLNTPLGNGPVTSNQKALADRRLNEEESNSSIVAPEAWVSVNTAINKQAGIPKMNSASIQTNSSMLQLTAAASCVLSNEPVNQFGQPEPSVTYRRRRVSMLSSAFGGVQSPN